MYHIFEGGIKSCLDIQNISKELFEKSGAHRHLWLCWQDARSSVQASRSFSFTFQGFPTPPTKKKDGVLEKEMYS